MMRGGRGGRGGGDYRGGGGRGGSSEFRGGGRGGSSEFRGGGRGGSSDFRGRGRGGASSGGAAPLAVRTGEFQVYTNHFPMSLDTKRAQSIYRHHVDFEGDDAAVLSREFKRMLVTRLLKMEEISGYSPYDGDHILLSKTPIAAKRYDVPINAAKTYSVSVRLNGTFNLTAGSALDRDRAQIIDLICQQASLVQNEQYGRAKFAPREPSNADWKPSSMESRGAGILVGHRQTVDVLFSAKVLAEVEGRIGVTSNPYQKLDVMQVSACIGPAAALLIKPTTLIDFIRLISNWQPGQPLQPSVLRKLNTTLKNLELFTKHCPPTDAKDPQSKKRCFKFLALRDDTNARSYIFEYEGLKMSMEDYFLRKYGIKLKHPMAPLVQRRPKARDTLVPIELCYVSIQKARWAWSNEVKSEVANLMCLSPDQRQILTRKTVQAYLGPENPVLREFGFAVEPKMLKWDAEMLSTPTVHYLSIGGGSRENATVPVNGAWNLRDRAFVSAQKVMHVMLACPRHPAMTEQNLSALQRELVKQMGLLGMGKQTQFYPFMFTDPRQIRQEMAKMRVKVSLAFVFLPRKDPALYKSVKCALDEYVPTQCLVIPNTPGLAPSKDLSRGAGHLANILMKVNEKHLGFNHTVSGTVNTLKILQHGGKESCMIMSVNMVNPQMTYGPRANVLPSIGCVLTSCNPEGTVYAHSIRIQRRGNNVIEELRDMMMESMKTRVKYGGKPPKRVVLLRDGLSVGDMVATSLYELQALRDTLTKMNVPDVAITYIMCVTSHSTRFFDVDNVHANLPPGTAVFKSGVVDGGYPNFILIGHAAIKGTSRPVRYFILEDTIREQLAIKEPLRFWANFVYQQSYLFQRCTRAVRVPAPIYFAQQIAERARILATKPLDAVFGVSLDALEQPVSDDGSSVVSFEDELIEKAYRSANTFLSKISTDTLPMFYC